VKIWPWSRKQPIKKAAQRAFAGAMYGRLVTDWIAASTSVDSEIKGSLRALRNRSRQLGRDNDYVKGFLREAQNNIVGEGIPFQAQVKKQRGGRLHDDINDTIHLKFDRWARKEYCHTGGTLAWEDIQRVCIRSAAEGGEIFARLVRQSFGGSKIPLAIELIEADQLDETLTGTWENGNEIRMGVEVDQWQRPVAYHFWQRHPGDFQFTGSQQVPNSHNRIRVPASEVIALQMFDRPGQTRSVPWLASAIMRLHQVGGFEEAEVIAARAGAALMGIIETPEGDAPAEETMDGDQVTEFAPGLIKKLGPGEKFTVPDMHRPNGQFVPFTSAMLRAVAAGAGTSYATMSRDYSASNFSSSRMDMLSERDNWRILQKWTIRNFHQRVFEAWLDMAVLAGELDLPGYETQPERYQNVKWMPRGWAWIDPVKEVTAAKEAILGGLSTQSQVLAQQGEDIEELLTQRAREVELAKKNNLVFDTDFANDKPVAPKGGPLANEDGGDAQAG
jgi:lambda family phage portal protein